MAANQTEDDWAMTSGTPSRESRGKLVIKSEGGRLGKLHHAYASLCRRTRRGFGLVVYGVMDRGRADEKGASGKIICRVEFMVLFVLWFNWKDWKQRFYTLQREYLLPVGLVLLCGLVLFFFFFHFPRGMTAGFLGSEFRVLTFKRINHFQIKGDLSTLGLDQDQI